MKKFSGKFSQMCPIFVACGYSTAKSTFCIIFGHVHTSMQCLSYKKNSFTSRYEPAT